jgi:hypothetical protein
MTRQPRSQAIEAAHRELVRLVRLQTEALDALILRHQQLEADAKGQVALASRLDPMNPQPHDLRVQRQAAWERAAETAHAVVADLQTVRVELLAPVERSERGLAMTYRQRLAARLTRRNPR